MSETRADSAPDEEEVETQIEEVARLFVAGALFEAAADFQLGIDTGRQQNLLCPHALAAMRTCMHALMNMALDAADGKLELAIPEPEDLARARRLMTKLNAAIDAGEPQVESIH